MPLDKALEQHLANFKRFRDAVVHADETDVDHHLREFVREIRRNPIIASSLATLPPFDADAWWRENVTSSVGRSGRLDAIAFPDDENERLSMLLDLADSMASDNRARLSIRQFGGLLGRHKVAAATAIAISLVVRPLADILTDKVRAQIEIANPAVRELAGVPLDRIPNEGETLIFLSHKSVDKPLVRPYYDLLLGLGLEPWLDEKDMKAGDTIHREIADGFDRSCAVVFFVTKHFTDERWLKREVDHAVSRKIERDHRFAIITLVFDNAPVPRPLRDTLWVTVTNEVVAAHEILRALPIQVGPSRWRK